MAQGEDEGVVVVERQEGAHSGFQAEVANGGLGSVVSRADGYSVLVEVPGDILRSFTRNHE